jgi:adenosylcobinamide kinase / adenosylcobinamide-phosphate guanylyltransferase
MSVTLVLGGARSGKSRHAESLARGEKIYIATAEIFDDEMRERVARHRHQRGGNWETLEVPLELVEAIQQHDAKGRFILVDCITIWISNIMHEKRDVKAEVAKLCAGLKAVKAKVILVSNEVGQGIVPDNALARAFRDEQGVANQWLGEAADEVVFVTAGLAAVLKKAKRKPESLRRASSSRFRKA